MEILLRLINWYRWEYNYYLCCMNNYNFESGTMSFEDFLTEYNKREWERQPNYRSSHFGLGDCRSANYIHAGYVRINNVSVFFSYKDFVRFKMWEKKHRLPKKATMPEKTWFSINNRNKEYNC